MQTIRPEGALLTTTVVNGGLHVAAAGPWTTDHAREVEALIDRSISIAPAVRSVTVDMRGIEEFDTYGAWLLERLLREHVNHGRQARVLGLSERHRDLLQEVQKANRTEHARDRKRAPFPRLLEAVGAASAQVAADAVALLTMLGAAVASLGRTIARPRSFRLTSAVHHLDRVAWQAVPIILLISFLIGCILTQQGIFHFRKFGADIYVVDMVGILVLREVGVLVVAIMVAGRSGSAYTAELGAMKMREEVDALRAMGVDPVEVLILPRVLALVLALPILTFLGSIAALYGGGLVAWLYGGLSPEIFLSRLKEAISLTHFEVGIVKAPFMALVIGIVACTEGFQVRGSAESLGRHTTASVVKSIFLVIVLDGMFAMLFAAVGM